MSRNRAPVDTSLQQDDLRFLIDRNADGLLVIDRDGRVLFANPAAEAAFGRPAAALVGSEIGLPAIAGETTEIAILRPGGSQIDAEMRAVETRWAGRPALLVSLRDISARKLVEDRLRQAHKMESIGRLTAGIAHDFNNLLTVIIGNLEIIQRETAGEGGNPKLARAVGHAAEGARRAASLTQRLLAFARRQPLEPRSTGINDLIRGMSDLVHRTLGEAISVETDLGEHELFALVDANQLEAALLNLATNARDAMPGGGRLEIATRRRELDGERSDLAAGPYVEICVRDTGLGMAPEVLARVFEPFFSTKETGRGTGLGLSQVFGFAKQSRGDVEIESVPGEGTAVKLYLPCAASAPPPVAAETAAVRPPARHAGALVLVVEDEEGVRNFSTDGLIELGYRVLQAADTAAALRILGSEAGVDLLFTDLNLQDGINGLALAEEARRRRPDLKVLLTTGYAGDDLMHDGRLDAGVELLPKPFTREALADKVRAVLRGHKPAVRILVVEDDLLVRLTVAETLGELGCMLEEAANGRDAADKFARLAALLDAAIIDVGLPDGRGDVLASAFRASRPDLPILFATGYEDPAIEAAFTADARVGVLQKPFDGAALHGALRALGVSLAD